MSKKKRSMSPGLEKKLNGQVRKGRRETIFKMINKKCDNIVPCYVCGKEITEEKYATLEHILPISHGGTDEMNNLWLSHAKCNNKRSDNLEYPCTGIVESLRFK